jgi:hypothetical protein
MQIYIYIYIVHSIDPEFRVMVGCGISHTNTEKVQNMEHKVL